MSEQIFNQRAVGAVLGSAVGDGSFGWARSEFTDDTLMAIVQAESILANEGLDGADLYERFRVWAKDANDVGIQTRAVLRSGLPWGAAAQHFERNARSGIGSSRSISPRRSTRRRPPCP